jgi:hypothetical protein
MYECILPYYNDLRYRERCWLRLLETPQGPVAIASEVQGNNGPSVTNAAEHIALTIMRRFNLDPEQLTLIEHYPPDSLSRMTRGEETYDLVKLVWLGEKYASPKWMPLTPKDVTHYLGETPPTRPFWEASGKVSYRCYEGKRRAIVHRRNADIWEAIVNESMQHSTSRRFQTLHDAQEWALDQRANRAAEYDSFPIGLRE